MTRPDSMVSTSPPRQSAISAMMGLCGGGGQGYGFKAAAGAGFADPNEDDTGFQYAGSFSILHEDTGLNLTLSSGFLERDNQSDPKNYYAKLGWLTNLFPFGWTAFGVDYTRSQILPTDDEQQKMTSEEKKAKIKSGEQQP